MLTPMYDGASSFRLNISMMCLRVNIEQTAYGSSLPTPTLYCRDMEVALNKIVPDSWTRDGTFHHTMEGEDDMPGHVKASLMGPSLNIPVSRRCTNLCSKNTPKFESVSCSFY